MMTYIKLPFRNNYILIENNNYNTYDDDIDEVRNILIEYI